MDEFDPALSAELFVYFFGLVRFGVVDFLSYTVRGFIGLFPPFLQAKHRMKRYSSVFVIGREQT